MKIFNYEEKTKIINFDNEMVCTCGRKVRASKANHALCPYCKKDKGEDFSQNFVNVNRFTNSHSSVRISRFVYSKEGFEVDIENKMISLRVVNNKTKVTTSKETIAIKAQYYKKGIKGTITHEDETLPLTFKNLETVIKDLDSDWMEVIPKEITNISAFVNKYFSCSSLDKLIGYCWGLVRYYKYCKLLVQNDIYRSVNAQIIEIKNFMFNLRENPIVLDYYKKFSSENSKIECKFNSYSIRYFNSKDQRFYEILDLIINKEIISFNVFHDYVLYNAIIFYKENDFTNKEIAEHIDMIMRATRNNDVRSLLTSMVSTYNVYKELDMPIIKFPDNYSFYERKTFSLENLSNYIKGDNCQKKYNKIEEENHINEDMIYSYSDTFKVLCKKNDNMLTSLLNDHEVCSHLHLLTKDEKYILCFDNESEVKKIINSNNEILKEDKEIEKIIKQYGLKEEKPWRKKISA